MFDDRKRLLYILIFAMIFGAVVVGMLGKDDADASSRTPEPRTHKITRIARNSDDYFAGMSDRQITQHARVVCALLRSGNSVETVVSIEARTVPAAHVGALLDAAISVYCPDYRPAVAEFIDRHS
jgi:hypothetical protein